MKQNQQNDFKNKNYFFKIVEYYKNNDKEQFLIFMLNTACMFTAITSNTILLKWFEKKNFVNKIGYFSRYKFRYLFQVPLKDYLKTKLYASKSTKYIYKTKQLQPYTLSQIIGYNMLCGSSVGLVNCLLEVRIRPKQDIILAQDSKIQELKLRKYYKDHNKSTFAYWFESIRRKNLGFSAILFAQCMKFSLVFGIFDTVQMTINTNEQHKLNISYIIPNLLIAGASLKLANIVLYPFYVLARFKRSSSSQIRIHEKWDLRFIYKNKSYISLLKQKHDQQNRVIKQFRQYIQNSRVQRMITNENFLRFGFRLAIYQYLKQQFYISFLKNIDQVNRQ